MSDEPEEPEEPEENEPGAAEMGLGLSEPSEGDIGGVGRLLDRLRALAATGEHTLDWLRAWAPAVFAAQKLAFTLFTLASHLRGATRDEGIEPLPEELRDDLADDLAGLRQAFPDAPTLLFGVDHLDALIDRALDDDLAREQAVVLGRKLSAAGDALIGRLLDALMEPEQFRLTPSQLTDYIGRVESLLQRLLDRWVYPRLFED